MFKTRSLILTASIIALIAAISCIAAIGCYDSAVVSNADNGVTEATQPSMPSGNQADVPQSGLQTDMKIPDIPDQGDDSVYVPAKLIISFLPSATDAEISEAFESINATNPSLLSDTNGVKVIEADISQGDTVGSSAERIAQNDCVAYAEPDWIVSTMGDEVSAMASVNDPYYSIQWALNGAYGVNASSAWDIQKGSSSNVEIAIIDNGFDISHPDLAANIDSAHAYKAVDGTSTVGVAEHGTHVAGIVSAVANNAIGVSGITCNAKIVPIDVTDSNGQMYTSSIIKAYQYIIATESETHVKVVNMSLGGYYTMTSSDALSQQIDAAYSAGILTVCAAGNITDSAHAATDPVSPAAYPTCVSVSNLQSDGTLNGGSCYGDTIDICAPGTAILSTVPTSSSSSGYAYMSGTSMASPLVSGCAALLFAKDASLTPDEAKTALYGTARDLGSTGYDIKYGNGEVQPAAALASLLHTTDITEASFSAIGMQIYTGLEIKPNVSVSLNGTTLVNGIDYTLSYSSNVSAGTARITANGIGKYSGSATTTFTISPKTISKTMFSASPTSIPYGSATTPAIAAKDGSNSMREGTDYTLESPNSSSVGTHYIIAFGKGNYAGMVSIPFSVYATVPSAPKELCCLAAVSSASLSWAAPSNDGGSAISSYSIERDGCTIGNTNSTSYTDNGLTSGKTYSYSIKANNSVGSGDAASVTCTTKTAAASSFDISGATVSFMPMTYTGSILSPSASVALNGNGLVEGRDYTISYSEQTDAGIWTATLTGTGSYAGTVTVPYTISKRNLSDVAFSILPATISYGSGLPQIFLSYNGKDLANGIDYSVSDMPTTVGTHDATVSGTGNFTGTASSAYVISAAKPSAPLELTAQVYGASVSLLWKEPSSTGGTPISSYCIYRDGIKIGTSSAPSYIDFSPSAGAHSYAVSAVTSAGESALSKNVSVTVASTDLPDGLYIFESSIDTSYVLTVGQASCSNGGNLQIDKFASLNSQKFQIKSLGNGYYSITAYNSGKSLDVTWGSTESGANIQQWDSNGTAAQTWRIRANSDGTYTFISVCSGKVLDVSAGRAIPGENVQQWVSNDTAAQKFKLVNTSPSNEIQNGIYRIQPSSSSYKSVDISAASSNSGANVQLWSWNGTAAQKFRIEYLNNGYYKIVALCSGKVLDVAAAGTTSGTNVQQWVSNGSYAQQWEIHVDSLGYATFTARCSGLCLDVSGGSISDGANIQTWMSNGTNAQKFKLVTTS